MGAVRALEGARLRRGRRPGRAVQRTLVPREEERVQINEQARHRRRRGPAVGLPFPLRTGPITVVHRCVSEDAQTKHLLSLVVGPGAAHVVGDGLNEA